jgi:siderophore synthetase component
MARKIFVLVAICVLLFTAACTPVSPQQKAKESADQVCTDLVLFTTSMNKLLDQEYADRNALEAQFSVVRLNFANLVQSIANLQSVETQNFQQAANDLITTYQNVPEGASVQETITLITDPLKQVKLAAEQLSTDLKCKPGN